MLTLSELAEPALSLAAASLSPDTLISNDRRIARKALRGARHYLAALRTPEYAEYNVSKVVEEALRDLAPDKSVFNAHASVLCEGDAEQVLAVLRVIVQSAQLISDAVLVVEIMHYGDTPLIHLTIDGPGSFQRDIMLDGMIPVQGEMLGHIWTMATRGGRIDETDRGLNLRLSGVRVIPDPIEPNERLFEFVRDAESRLYDLSAASPVVEDPEEIRRAHHSILHALEILDDKQRRHEPTDLESIAKEVCELLRPELERRSITVEATIGKTVPSILVNRIRVRSYFVNALRHALLVLPRGGDASILVDYDSQSREVSAAVIVQGPGCDPSPTAYTASMRRSIECVHSGRFVVYADAGSVTCEAALPDAVGKGLDAWLPGFDAFSQRSRQMLRLLKSGAQALPEETILNGVLEEELERWLLPRLQTPPAVTLAPNMSPRIELPPGASRERACKALKQIGRGKPKKEICQPSYAGEVIWAFGVDERHKRAVGAEGLDDSQLHQLCVGLLATPPNYVECLRVLAQRNGN